MPQGLITYEGIDNYVVSGSFTLSPGVTPSVATIEVVPLPSVPSSNGTLRIVYGATIINFPGCRLDSKSSHWNEDGTRTETLTILDRRWRWARLGAVHGEWNVRNGMTIQTGTEKTPQQLISLCLDALGEVGYVVTAVPNFMRPSVNWDYTYPAEALSQLCDELGLVICLGPGDNKVYVVPHGYTTVTFTSTDAVGFEQGIDPPDPPGGLVIVGAKTRYQYDLALEPVGKELDGTWKKIGDLSYAPGDSSDPIRWSRHCPPESGFFSLRKNPALTIQHFDLAEKYIYRAYRVVTPIKGQSNIKTLDEAHTFTIPNPPTGTNGWNWPNNNGLEVDSRSINILNELNDTYTEGEETRRKPAVVWGDLVTFHSEKPVRTGSSQLKGMRAYEGNWDIDHRSNVIILDQQIWTTGLDYQNNGSSWVKVPNSRRRRAATVLFLKTAFTIDSRDYGGRGRARYTKTLTPGTGYIPSSSSVIRYEVCEDCQYENTLTLGSPDTFTNNKTTFDAAAEYYWDRYAAEYQPKDSLSVKYIGFKLVGNDGAVRQINWSVGRDGKAYTTISRNREYLNLGISYSERMFIERTRAQHTKQARQSKASNRENRRKGRG